MLMHRHTTPPHTQASTHTRALHAQPPASTGRSTRTGRSRPPALPTSQSKSQQWETPAEVVDYVLRKWVVDFDACASPLSALAPRYATADDDFLARTDLVNVTIFCNHPMLSTGTVRAAVRPSARLWPNWHLATSVHVGARQSRLFPPSRTRRGSTSTSPAQPVAGGHATRSTGSRGC